MLVSEEPLKRFSINVWVGIIGDYTLKPYFLPECLNGAMYQVFLQHVVLELLLIVPAKVQQDMYFLHYDTATYFSRKLRNTSMLHTEGGRLNTLEPLLGLHIRRISIR